MRSRRGFTLFEMVAAMVLMTILFAAMTSLLRSFAVQRKALERIAERNPPTQQLAELLRRDLTNARFARRETNGLTLVGNLSREWGSRTPTGRTAEVNYRTEVIAGEPWLIRREVHLDVPSTDRVREEPIWRGASGIELISLREISNNENGGAGMLPMPARFKLVVARDDNSALIELNVLHHWEDN